MDTSGVITTVAGNGTEGYSGDGGQPPAPNSTSFRRGRGRRRQPLHRRHLNNVIRKVDSRHHHHRGRQRLQQRNRGFQQRRLLRRWRPRHQRRVEHPYAVAVDKSGNLYIADTYNHRIRKVDTSGIITTVAGNGPVPDPGGLLRRRGTGHRRRTRHLGVAVDTAGNTTHLRSEQQPDPQSGHVRHHHHRGQRRHHAGISSFCCLPPAPQCPSLPAWPWTPLATSTSPTWATIASARWTATGAITTVAGKSTPGLLRRRGAATAAELNFPFGVAVDASGDILIADTGTTAASAA